MAVSVENDDQWKGLRAALGDPPWAADPAFDDAVGRHQGQDRLDEQLGIWASGRGAGEAADLLAAHGVPAAYGRDPRTMASHPTLLERGFYEPIDHAVVGRRATPTVPFRYASVDRWLRSAAPLLGQHNHEVLGGLLGLTEEELALLEADGVIGTHPNGL